MAFNPNIKYNPSLSAEDNFKVLYNWLNFALREMTVGRVPQAKEDADKTAGAVTELESALAMTDEAAIELYEAQAEQEAINAAQDEALIEIYEMMEV